MTQVSIHGFTIDLATLPPASTEALIRRGLSHVLGNEAASKVSGFVKRQAEANPPVDVPDATKAALLADARKEAYEAILGGTLGARTIVPKGDTVEGIMNAKAKTEVIGVLNDNKLGVPKKADETVVTASGSFTMAELIARRLAKHGDRLRKEAEKELKARKAVIENESVADL